MNKTQIFNHEAFGDLPVIVIDGEEWFGATEVARALSFSDPYKAINNHVDSEDSTVHPVLTEGGQQSKKFINESGLYSLIFGASRQGNNPDIRDKAKAFRKWVTSEVLPSIRKHGAYMTDQTLEQALTSPDFLIQLATRLKDEKEARIAAETKIAQQAPLVGFAESCMASDKSVLVRELAKLLSKQGLVIGEIRLYQKLREWGYIFRGGTEPTQRAMDAGYFEVSQGVKQKPDGGSFVWNTTRVTPKGQIRIADRLKKEMSTEGSE